MKKIITVTVALILMLTLVSCAKSEEEVAAEEAFNAEVARIQAELEERDADVEAAQAVVDDERPALDDTLKPALQTAISEASAIEFDAPKASGGVEEINAATEELKKITYTDQLQSLKDATKALSDSIDSLNGSLYASIESISTCNFSENSSITSFVIGPLFSKT